MTRCPDPFTSPRVEGRGQTQGGQIGRADTRPGRPRENGARAIRPPNEAVGRIELGVWARAATDVLHGGALTALLVVEQAGPGSHQAVVAGAITMLLMIAVARDGARDHLGVEVAQRRVVKAKTSGCPRRKAVDDDVGLGGQSQKRLTTFRRLQVQPGAALAAVPDPVPGLIAERISPGRLDAGHPGAVVDEEHRCHGPGSAPRQVENVQSFEHSSHCDHLPLEPWWPRPAP